MIWMLHSHRMAIASHEIRDCRDFAGALSYVIEETLRLFEKQNTGTPRKLDFSSTKICCGYLENCDAIIVEMRISDFDFSKNKEDLKDEAD